MATAGVVETAELADLACGEGIFSQPKATCVALYYA